MNQYKIAITSSDGININEHFGHTKELLIVEVINNETYNIFEKREVAAGTCGEHNTFAMQNKINAIKDCKYVLSIQIGQGMKRELYCKGISFYEVALPIEEAVKKVMKYNANNGVIKAEQYKLVKEENKHG